ncbi:MAG: tRNA uridine-5-carboxymethylaminomethyl(34) synthesis GTPase MnmE [Rhodobacteraceae bacterium]|nr:tRNA uridine-5-carboxymethylaminomethyl(34) synthesis GTPase MnmE [Paracoccaceae bacterium]
MDTIFALATAQGKAGVAVVRVSGPGSWDAGRAMAGVLPPVRSVGLRQLSDASGAHLDDALVLPFAGPHSFTGEDSVELHLHGSVAVVGAVLRRLSEFPGLRMAEPGEFTRRALENNRLDLTQVEGLADLIDAETEAQRKQAQLSLAGALGSCAESWRASLIRAAALIEATLDFADEDVPVDVTPEVRALLDGVQDDLRQQVDGTAIAERIRSGFEVAIVGPPNVGKSTLLNALAGRDAAITSETAGTTRDIIEVRMDIAGLPVTLLDTAGLRESLDEVERIGMDRARQRAAAADLRIFLTEGADPEGVVVQPGDIRRQPKSDLNPDVPLGVSGLTGQGIDALVAEIGSVLRERTGSAGLATRERHRAAMQNAIGALEAAKAMLEHGPECYDIVAEELRSGVRALESLVGRIGVENLLDEIFASFCLGK